VRKYSHYVTFTIFASFIIAITFNTLAKNQTEPCDISNSDCYKIGVIDFYLYNQIKRDISSQLSDGFVTCFPNNNFNFGFKITTQFDYSSITTSPLKPPTSKPPTTSPLKPPTSKPPTTSPLKPPTSKPPTGKPPTTSPLKPPTGKPVYPSQPAPSPRPRPPSVCQCNDVFTLSMPAPKNKSTLSDFGQLQFGEAFSVKDTGIIIPRLKLASSCRNIRLNSTFAYKTILYSDSSVTLLVTRKR
jgi:hypothetical protein